MLDKALEALITAIPGPVFLRDLDGRYLLANGPTAVLYGLTDPKDVIGKTDIELRPNQPDEAKEIGENDRSVLPGQPLTREIPMTNPVTGEKRWFQSLKTLLREEDGTPIGILGVTHDITVLKESARLAREQKDAAISAEAMKSRFLASVSHDLRQPLQVMFMVASVMEKHTAPDGKKLLERMQTALQVQKNMLDSLLDISVLDAGLTTPTVTEFSLNELMIQINSSFITEVKRKGLVFMDNISKDHVHLHTDRALFSRILSNLVGNAVRFTNNGIIELVGQNAGDNYIVAVRDTGVGIGADQLPLIWQEFHQVSNPSRDREKGLGLGLSVVKKIAALLDLKVEVTSTLGHGSVFSITVPRVLTPTMAEVSPELNMQQGFIVLVDDDALVRDTIMIVMEELGYRVVSAQSTAEALEMLKDEQSTPEMLVIDFRLQGETGIDSARVLRQRFGTVVPSVLLTGDLTNSTQALAMANDMRLLPKPISMAELASVLGEAKTLPPL